MNEYLSNGRLWRLCQKELRESLRDRRTLFTLVLMPILVYPLLSIALQRLVIGTVTKTKADPVFVLGAESEDTASQLQSMLAEARAAIAGGFVSPITITRTVEPKSLDAAKSTADPVGNDEPSSDLLPKFDIFISDQESLSKALRIGQLDLVITKMNIDQVS